MKIDWTAKAQHLLQTAAFCLAIAALQQAFSPDRPYAPLVTYSLAIGLVTWAFIDLGRHLLPSAAETGWPTGLQGLVLVVGGIVGGYVLGNVLGDQFCRSFGWYGQWQPPDLEAEGRRSLLITVLAGIVGSYWFYTRNKNTYLEARMAEATRLATESRLKLLEAQLEPHMLFNTLANLRVLIGIDPKRAQQMLDHLNAYLRATLGASRATQHALQAEFERLRDYLALMQIRMGPRLDFALELPEALAAARVPTLLLQPLVENAIQHGLEPKVEGGRIDVIARCEGDVLVLEVRDSGVGLGEELAGSAAAAGSGAIPATMGGGPGSGSGFGLRQVRERLSTLHAGAASVVLQAREGGGTVACLRMPLGVGH